VPDRWDYAGEGWRISFQAIAKSAAGRGKPGLRPLGIPDAEPRRRILDHLSAQVQRPCVKINHALVLGGGQGIGKDSLLKPLIEALGPHNAGIITPLELDGAFNDFLINKSLLLVQEIAAFGTRGLATYHGS
jgi:hypothetical protein